MKIETVAEIYCFLEEMKYPVDVEIVKNALCNAHKIDTMWAMIEKTGNSKSVFYNVFVDFFLKNYLTLAVSHPKIFQKLLDKLPVNQTTADIVFDLLKRKQITIRDSDFQKYFHFFSERQIQEHFFIGSTMFELILAALRNNCTKQVIIDPNPLISSIFSVTKNMKEIFQKLTYYYQLLDYKPFFKTNWDNQDHILRIIREFKNLLENRTFDLSSMEYNYNIHYFFDILEKVGRESTFEQMISVFLPVDLYKSWCGIIPQVIETILAHSPDFIPECCKNSPGNLLWNAFKLIPNHRSNILSSSLITNLLAEYTHLSANIRILFGWLLYIAGDSDLYEIVQSTIQEKQFKPSEMLPLLPAITKNGRKADWLIPYFEKIKNILDIFNEFREFYYFAATIYQVDCTQINIWIHFLSFILEPRFNSKYIPGLLFLNSLDESTRKHAVNWIMETQSLEDRKKYLNVYDMLVISGYKDWFSKKALAGMKEVFDVWLNSDLSFHHWYIIARFLAVLPPGTYFLKDLKECITRYDCTSEGFKCTQIFNHLFGSSKHDSDDLDPDNKILWDLIALSSNELFFRIIEYAVDRFYLKDIKKFLELSSLSNKLEGNLDKEMRWITTISSMFLKFPTNEILNLTSFVVQQVSGQHSKAIREIWFEIIRRIERERGIRWIAYSDAFQNK